LKEMVFSVVNLQLHILVNQLSLPILSGIAHTDFIQVFYIFLIIVYHLEVGEGLSPRSFSSHKRFRPP